jgi:hypothetical protein
MANQSNAELAQHQEALNQREASLQGRMDHMLNQRWVSMEQEFKRRRTENIEACCADFCSKTDAALVRYKQGRENPGAPGPGPRGRTEGSARGAPGRRARLG